MEPLTERERRILAEMERILRREDRAFAGVMDRLNTRRPRRRHRERPPETSDGPSTGTGAGTGASSVRRMIICLTLALGLITGAALLSWGDDSGHPAQSSNRTAVTNTVSSTYP